MTRKTTPDGCWPSDTIDDFFKLLAHYEGQITHVAAGVDGGITGAIGLQARVGDTIVAGAVLDLPVIADPGSAKKGRNALDLRTLDEWVARLPAYAVVAHERYVALPASVAAQMRGRNENAARGVEASNVRKAGTDGELRGLLAAASRRQGFRVLAPPMPAQWRKVLGLGAIGGDKEKLRETARRMFSRLDHRLGAKAHHNRAEALLLSEYAMIART